MLTVAATGLAALMCWLGAPAFAQSNNVKATTTAITVRSAQVAPVSRPLMVPATAKAPTAKAPAATAAVHIAPKKLPTAAVHAAATPPTTVAVHPRPVVPVATRPTPAPASNNCTTALSYLAAHSAPGFRFECPGYAQGHQAETCINVPGVCPGSKLIVIAVVCAASYMNEASNSWVLSGLASRPIDPYGHCS